jgi:hypothetical protein
LSFFFFNTGVKIPLFKVSGMNSGGILPVQRQKETNQKNMKKK